MSRNVYSNLDMGKPDEKYLGIDVFIYIDTIDKEGNNAVCEQSVFLQEEKE